MPANIHDGKNNGKTEYMLDFYDKTQCLPVGTVLIVDRILKTHDYDSDAEITVAILRVMKHADANSTS